MLGVSYKTAWYLRYRIRAAMKDETPELLREIVEAGKGCRCCRSPELRALAGT